MTIQGSGGQPVQVSQSVLAQAQMGLLQPSPDGTITVQGSDGKPVKVPQAAIASAPSVLPNLSGGKEQRIIGAYRLFAFLLRYFHSFHFGAVTTRFWPTL